MCFPCCPARVGCTGGLRDGAGGRVSRGEGAGHGEHRAGQVRAQAGRRGGQSGQECARSGARLSGGFASSQLSCFTTSQAWAARGKGIAQTGCPLCIQRRRIRLGARLEGGS
eukprot:7980753-Pyramimonas_sp.AAC.1